VTKRGKEQQGGELGLRERESVSRLSLLRQFLPVPFALGRTSGAGGWLASQKMGGGIQEDLWEGGEVALRAPCVDKNGELLRFPPSKKRAQRGASGRLSRARKRNATRGAPLGSTASALP